MSEIEEKTICYCKGVSEETIVNAIRDGARTLDDIKRLTGACTGDQCKILNPKGRCCSTDILKLIEIQSGTKVEGCCSCE